MLFNKCLGDWVKSCWISSHCYVTFILQKGICLPSADFIGNFYVSVIFYILWVSFYWPLREESLYFSICFSCFWGFAVVPAQHPKAPSWELGLVCMAQFLLHVGSAAITNAVARPAFVPLSFFSFLIFITKGPLSCLAFNTTILSPFFLPFLESFFLVMPSESNSQLFLPA